MGSGNGSNRREFLKDCIAGAAVLGTGGNAVLSHAAELAKLPKSTVVVARDAMLRESGTTVDSKRIAALLDGAMQACFKVEHPADAWKKVVRSGDRVGLKINAIAGRGLSTNIQLIEAVCERLQQAGIRAGDITVWDRDTAELERAGFRIATDSNKIQYLGTDRVGFETDPNTYGSVTSRVSKLLAERSDVMINLPILKDHGMAGVTAALKNMYGVIHNPNQCHSNNCNPYVADVNMLPAIRTKMRLTICDATTACYEGGPRHRPEFAWNYNALIVSQDPVALDYTGWQIIERKRAEAGLKTLEASGKPPAYIATAADNLHRLGTNDPKRITLREV